MVSLSALWLPIVLSAVAVFVVSSIIHMALPFWHKNDYPKIPREEQVMAALRPLAIPPGDYMVPRCETAAEMRTPEFDEKMKQGPVLVVTVLPSAPWPFGSSLLKWFLYCVVVGTLCALTAAIAFGPGADDHDVFHVIALTAFAGYALALWQMTIWYARSLTTTLKATIDGAIFALVTAWIFVWRWPGM